MTSTKVFSVGIGMFMLIACVPSKLVNTSVSIEDVKWLLVEYNGAPYTASEGTTPVSLTLQSENHSVKGFGGCNNFSGSYTHNENSIQFTLLSTKMLCQETMQVEDYLFKTLIKVEYSMEGDFLMLKNEEGHFVKFIKS